MAYKKLIKVSNVCQLLDKSKYPATGTDRGITFTNNGDGSITVNGTATGEYYSLYTINVNLDSVILGHKYAILGTGTNIQTVIIGNYAGGYIFKNSNSIYTFPKHEYTRIVYEIRAILGVNFSNVMIKPQLFDLTEMYGEGHEPTTVAQFRQDFPEETYDYSPRCWLTSYKRVFTCKTKNLLSFPYYGQYETKQGITFSKVSTYKVNASGINTGSTGCTFDFNYNKVFKAGTYTIKFYTEGSVPPELYYRIRKDSYYGGTIISDKEFQKTFTLSEDTVLFISFGIYGTMSPQYTGKKINVNVWCQIEKGNTATDYVPYGIIPSYQRNLTCKTKNLFDIPLIQGYPSNTNFDNSTKRTFTIGTYIVGLARNNYYEENYIKTVNVSKNRISFKLIGGWFGVSIPCLLTVGKTYTFSCKTDKNYSTNIGISYYKENGELISYTDASGNNHKIVKYFTVPENTYYTLILFTGANSDEYTYYDIQLELSDTATEYVPYGHL